MTAPLLMVTASLLFAAMGVCVKWASAQYGTGEIVFYRGLIGALMMALLARRGGRSLRTTLPGMHLGRCLVGVSALLLWFFSIGQLPLGTAVTLNYTSSVWMALFMIGGAVFVGQRPAGLDLRLVATVLVGFGGVALVLRPTIEQNQLWYGLMGLGSGVLSALAYLQVMTLGRAGEPEYRVVFYFSLTGMAAGGAIASGLHGWHAHDLRGAALLLAIGGLATSAQMMMTRAYAIGATLANAALQYLGIVFSSIFGALLFDDPITGMALAGMALIVVAGLAATRLRSTVPVDAAARAANPNES
jgi:drug/metabolite transporter (DMT)-like permease